MSVCPHVVPWERFCLDRLLHGWYASCGLPQENCLILITFNNLGVTARIRRMREGNIFSLCVSPHLQGVPPSTDGGVPIRTWWGYPIILNGWGYPILPDGGTLHPDLGRGYLPVQAWEGGTPLSRPGKEVPPPPSRSGSRTGGCTPIRTQHGVHLLRSGRNASCVQAGGLSSCCFLKWSKIEIRMFPKKSHFVSDRSGRLSWCKNAMNFAAGS